MTGVDRPAEERGPAEGGRSRDPVLILGATSGIARCVAAAFARDGHDLVLAGRDLAEMRRDGRDLATRYGVDWTVMSFDAREVDDHAEFSRAVLRVSHGSLAGVVLAFGALGDQELARTDVRHALDLIEVNFLGAVSVLSRLTEHLIPTRSGFIAVITSVAGDRGRPGNYTYGAAKGGLALWLQGLRARLHGSGVHVLTVKPGFVDTGMTYGREGMFLVADPDRVARAIVRAIRKRKDVIYVPWFWRPIMALIRLIPERIFKRLDL